MPIYRVRLIETVLVTVPDEVIQRTQTDDWKDSFYDLDESETLLMLADHCGVHQTPIDHLDGWGDVEPSEVTFELIETDILSYDKEG